MERSRTNALKAYKRAPALPNSTWYKGMLFSQMAGPADNGGTFDFVVAKMRPGTEPPPHVHSREDEFFYILSGKLRVYVDGKVFTVTPGECVFLPRQRRHRLQSQTMSVRLLRPRVNWPASCA